MNQPHGRGRNGQRLLVLIALALAYGVLLHDRGTLTGAHRVDGAIGVILGLYICSHPAANAVDRLFFGRSTPRAAASRGADIVWLVLNVLALLAGWIVIVVGAAHLTM